MRVFHFRRKFAGVEDPRGWLGADRLGSSGGAEEAGFECLSRRCGSKGGPASLFLEAADETVMGREIAAVVERLIPALSAPLRDVLTLSTLAEMSPPDVAGVLNINKQCGRDFSRHDRSCRKG